MTAGLATAATEDVYFRRVYHVSALRVIVPNAIGAGNAAMVYEGKAAI